MKGKIYREKKIMQPNWDFCTHLFALIYTFTLFNAFHAQ